MPKEFPYSFAVVGRAPVVQDSHFESLANVGTHTSPSLNANQAFGRSTAKAARARKSARRRPSSRDLKLSVLVVDDVPDVTEMIALFLKHADYDVATADSATKALRLAYERTFNLIISDIGMPEMNGYELAESLRRRPEYRGYSNNRRDRLFGVPRPRARVAVWIQCPSNKANQSGRAAQFDERTAELKSVSQISQFWIFEF
jgi:CheY-like chemotaxis protein